MLSGTAFALRFFNSSVAIKVNVIGTSNSMDSNEIGINTTLVALKMVL